VWFKINKASHEGLPLKKKNVKVNLDTTAVDFPRCACKQKSKFCH
jgi:hypothetical protein